MEPRLENQETGAAIEALGLTKRFGTFTAVDRIGFSVRAGEIFGFLGANGAGKTTAIRMLCGLLEPTSGKGRVAGFDIMRESARIRSRIGYMSQKFSLYSDLTVRDNLFLFGSLYGLAGAALRKRIDEMAAFLDIKDLLPRVAGSLPWGWQQRLSLACANLHAPHVLFLDEPTGSVDPLSRRRFWDFIAALSKRGTTIFVTTHHMDEAEYCDRISIMVAGRIAALDGALVPITVSSLVLFNPRLRSSWYMVPALVVILVTIITGLLSGLSIVKEKEAGTLEQLMAAPVDPMHVIAGKTLPYLIIGVAEICVFLAIAVAWFRIPFRGNFFELLLFGVVYMLSSLGIGILTSTVARTSQQVLFLIWFIMIFFILLSGFFIPIENMPPWVQRITMVNPVRYFMFAVREMFLKGSGLAELWRELVAMLAIGTAVFGASAALFQRRAK